MKPDLEEGDPPQDGERPSTPRQTPVIAPPFFGGAAAEASDVPHGQGRPGLGLRAIAGAGSAVKSALSIGTAWKSKAKKRAENLEIEDLLDPLQMLNSQTITTYEAEELTNWSAVTMYAGTVFTQPVVLRIVGQQLGTCWAVVYLLFYFSSHPEHYRTDAVDEIARTISISIAFMLGLFLNTCLNRWWDTVEGLQLLLSAVKDIVMRSIAVGVSNECRATLARRAMLSVRMLQAELLFNKKLEQHSTESIFPWAKMKPPDFDAEVFWDEKFAELLELGQITQEEMDVMRSVPMNQRSFFAWSLVGKEMRKNRKQFQSLDGKYNSVAYDRIMMLVQAGITGVSQLKHLGKWQLPFIYVHMLAFMVHFVNICTAAGTGCTLGVVIATASARHEPLDTSTIASKMVYIVVQAFIYQAFLSIGTALSFPLAGQAYKLPLEEEIAELDGQIYMMKRGFDIPVRTGTPSSTRSPASPNK